MKREYGSWMSGALSRPMEYLWFGDRGRPVLFFPTSMGRFYQNEDFGLTGALAEKVDAGWLQLVCVDSVDAESWYTKKTPPADRARRHDEYDRYLRDEMLPYITSRTGGNIVTVGASFGAYHAANVAARYPGVVTKAICFSGIYDVYQFLDGYWDDTCYFHTPMATIANMDEAWKKKLRQVEWVGATGEDASLVKQTRGSGPFFDGQGQGVRPGFGPGVFGQDGRLGRDHPRRFI